MPDKLRQDYRDILHAAVLERKAKLGRACTFAKMAAACKLQRPYLSSVLQGHGHLSADQLYLACDFLGFTDTESELISLLYELERSGCAKRRRALERKIKAHEQAALTTGQHLAAKPLATDTSALQEFYLDLEAQLVHMFLAVPKFRNEPVHMQQALQLDGERLQQQLLKLERAGIIRLVGTGPVAHRQVEVLVEALHLPAESPLFPIYRMQMRLKALERMQTRPQDQPYSFSVLFAAGDETKRKIQARFLEFIAWAEDLAISAPSSQVYQLNFDLLQWS